MSLILKASDVFVEYKGRTVLDIPELELYEHDRIGLIGFNGVGKTTLLRLLAGEMEPEEGEVRIYGEVSLIPQFDSLTDDRESSEAQVGDRMKERVKERVHFEVADVDDTLASGGELTRIKLAEAFSLKPQAILADEPTSHLDAEGVELLIAASNAYQGALLVVSHNREFLDKTVHKIWELDEGRITEYWGTYSDYQEQRVFNEASQARRHAEYLQKKEHLEAIIREKRKEAQKLMSKSQAKKNASNDGGRLGHQKSQGSKQKALHAAIKSVEKQLDSLEEEEAPSTLPRVRFKMSTALELHNKFPLVGEDVTLRVGDTLLCEGFNFEVPLGSKTALVGKNGCGKTTLLKHIMSEGQGIKLAPRAEIGYFSQIKRRLESKENVLAFMERQSDYSITEIRSALASVGLRDQDVKKSVTVLSGGQTVKLLLIETLLGRNNILLLDEPDNYLDTRSIEALQQMIKDYKGTVLFVSHDSRLIEEVADRTLRIPK